MTNFRLYIKLLIISLLLSTCKKIYYKESTVKGVFWDYCREKPFSGFKMKLVEACYCEFGGRVSYKDISETTTDANGVFDFGELKLDKRLKKRFYKVYAVTNEDDSLSKGLGGNVDYPNIKNISEWFPRAGENNYDTLRQCSF